MSIQQLAQGFFQSNAFIGIGTTAPTASVHVFTSNASPTFGTAGILLENGSIGETGIGLRNASMGNRAWVIGTDCNSTRLDMAYGVASNQLITGDARLSVTSDGRVGVGITDPSFAVDVSGYVRSSLGFRVGNNEVIDSDGNFVIRTVQLLDSSGGTALYVTNTGNVGIGTDNPQNKLDIIGIAGVTGNLGIGTTSPTHRLHIYSTSTTNNNYESSGIFLENAATGESALAIRGGAIPATSNWFMGVNSNQTRLDIGYGLQANQLDDASADLSILPSGNVGIGTTNPSSSLHVEGTVRVSKSDNSVDAMYIQSLNPYRIWNSATAIWLQNDDSTKRANLNIANKNLTGTNEVTLQINGKGVSSADSESLYLGWTSTEYQIRTVRTGAGTSNNLNLGTTLYPYQLVLHRDGNVGIGTTIPQQRLHVDGTVRATQFVGDGSQLTNIQASSPTLWSIGAGSNNFTMCNVGIGITNPQKRLEVSGTNATLRISDYTANGTPSIELVRGTSNTFGGDGRTDWRITASNNQLIISEGDINGNSNVLALSPDGHALLGSSTQWASYRTTSNVYWTQSNLLLPSANGTLNGVNITALNKKTRVSRATVERCVSTWIPRNFGIANDTWYAVCWSPELSLFCAVSENARCTTSEDGINWTRRDINQTGVENILWYSICWSPELSLFCVVGSPKSNAANYAMTSTDGLNWTLHDLSAIGAGNAEWTSVCWSSELSLFCAVAWNNYVITSPDGSNWTNHDISMLTNSYDMGLSSVCWSPELSIFCVTGENVVLTSSNGSTWRAHDLSGTGAEFNIWYSISWSPELLRFCAVGTTANGSTTNLAMTSSDGISWTIQNMGESTKFYSICWSPDLSLFCAVSYYDSRVLTSRDGIHWNGYTIDSENNFTGGGVCWSPELSIFCIVHYFGYPYILTSRPALPAPKSAVLANPSHATVNPATGNFGIGTTNPTHRLHVFSSNIMDNIIEPANIFLEHAATGEAAIAIRGGAIPSTSNWFIGVNSNQTRLGIGYGLDIVSANMSFLTDGNVGIGTTIPQQLLHVEGNASIINGNVGIGTHTPLANLHIHADISSNIYNLPFDETGDNFIRIYEFNIPSGFLDDLQTSVYFTVGNSGPLKFTNYVEFGPYTKTELFYTPSGTPLPGFGNYPVTLYYFGKTFVKNTNVGIGTDIPRQLLHVEGNAIVTNGNVGIGTVLPSHKLHVWANNNTNNAYEAAGLMLQNAGTGETGLAIQTSAMADNSWYVGVNSNQTRLDISYGTQIYQSADSFANVTILTDGNMGIGTIDPQYELHVEGTAFATTYANLPGASTESAGIVQLDTSTESTSTTTAATPSAVKSAYDLAAGALSRTTGGTVENDLIVQGTITASNLLVLGDVTTVDTYVSQTSNVSIVNTLGTGPALRVSQSGVGFQYSIAEFYDTDVSTTTPVFKIAEGGNIGIGTTTPRHKLEISGSNATIRISDYTTQGAPALEFLRGASGTFGGDASTDWRITASNNQLIFQEGDTNGSCNVLALSASGNALMGANVPAWASYRTASNVGWTASNLMLPVAYGTLNGVNLTALNQRTRASYATANTAVTNWISRTAQGTAVWNDVCWSSELSRFCAVGELGANGAMTSSDGITWTAQATLNSRWKRVCWSPELSLFCAVASSNVNNAMTSPNGSTWTLRTIGASNFNSVCWSPELSLFCAVGDTTGAGALRTSPDGIVWTPRPTQYAIWHDVCWSPELSLFCAVGDSGFNQATTSLDGITWTPRSPNGSLRGICWSPELSLFCAVGTNLVTTSPDGILWTTRGLSQFGIPSRQWTRISWSPELSIFCAVADTGSGNSVMTSEDGIVWRMSTFPTTDVGYGVCWSSELSVFCVVTGPVARVMTSTAALPAPKSAVLANPAHVMVNQADGNVGIGTTNPLATLQVHASIPSVRVSSSTNASTNYFNVSNGTFVAANSGTVTKYVRFNLNKNPCAVSASARFTVNVFSAAGYGTSWSSDILLHAAASGGGSGGTGAITSTTPSNLASAPAITVAWDAYPSDSYFQIRLTIPTFANVLAINVGGFVNLFTNQSSTALTVSLI